MLRVDAERWIKAGSSSPTAACGSSVVVTNGVSRLVPAARARPNADGWSDIRAVREGDACELSAAGCRSGSRRSPAASHVGPMCAAPQGPGSHARFLSSPADLTRSLSGEITLAFRRWRGARVKVGIPPEDADRRARGRRRSTSFESDRARTRAPPGRDAEACASVPTAQRFTASRCTSPARTRGSPCASSRPTPPLLARLERMGPWTYEYLAIADQPGRSRGRPRRGRRPRAAGFKRDVRRLKELGLTDA